MEEYPSFESVSTKAGSFSENFHQKVETTCEFQISDKCRKDTIQEFRAILRTKKRNEGKYICLYCSRFLKFSGRLNPNVKYQIDDDMFSIINTEGKAYTLGWIASGGLNNSSGIIAIDMHQKDLNCLLNIRDIIDCHIPIKQKTESMISLLFCSTKIVKDVCNHLSITPGKKLQFPGLQNHELQWAFIRGYFDGDGAIRRKKSPGCKITSNSSHMLQSIQLFCDIPSILIMPNLTFSGCNALDFLSKLYDDSNPLFRLERKYDLYMELINSCQSGPSTRLVRARLDSHESLLIKGNKSFPHCRIYKTTENAVIPHKKHKTDVGLDLTIINEIKKIGDNTIMYDTGIKVFPSHGYYVQVYPRSSISRSGYMFTNSTAIIDPNYLGSIKIVLTKVDKSLPNLSLPFTCAQMILCEQMNPEIEEIHSLDEIVDTQRGEGGFGSTGFSYEQNIVAEGSQDISRVAEGSGDTSRVAEGSGDTSRVAEGSGDTSRVAEGSGDTSRVDSHNYII